ESLQVIDEGTRVRAGREPGHEGGAVRCGQVEAHLIRQLDDGLRAQPAIEVVMQGDLRQGVETHATTLQQENLGGSVHATNLPVRALSRPVVSHPRTPGRPRGGLLTPRPLESTRSQQTASPSRERMPRSDALT